MKIDTITAGEIDTDTLTDGESELAVKVKEFETYLKSKNAHFLIMAMVPEKKRVWFTGNLTDSGFLRTVITGLDKVFRDHFKNSIGLALLPLPMINACNKILDENKTKE